jgi:hypothetical protein
VPPGGDWTTLRSILDTRRPPTRAARCGIRVASPSPKSTIALALAALVAAEAQPSPPAATSNRLAVELSPVSVDWYYGGEYVADEPVSSAALGVAFEHRLWPHLAAGAALTYVQPGSVVLPLVPGFRFKRGEFTNGELVRSSRMVLPALRVRLLFPFAARSRGDWRPLQAGAALLLFPGEYRGWGMSADLGVDGTWFWSRWGGTVRASGGFATTEGSKVGLAGFGRRSNAGIDRAIAWTVTCALVRKL